MQRHAAVEQILHGRCVLRVPAQQADRTQPEAAPGCGQRVQVVGMRPAQTDQPLSPGRRSRLQVMQ